MTADPTSDQRTDGKTAEDRRRPGRIEQVSPTLVGLLRGKADAEAPRTGEPEAGDELGAARGILFAVVAGLAIWGLLFWAIRALLR
jgi:hypothetical protein